MLIDTHCHINIMVKKTFDTPLTEADYAKAQPIITLASQSDVKKILNVGTSLIESKNCIALAQRFESVYASVGIHPNDLTDMWKNDMATLAHDIKRKQELKIVAIGECGVDKHYPDYNIVRQMDAFRYQIEVALAHDLALVIHSRDAYEETLQCLEEYKNQGLRGTIHCFSEDLAFARTALSLGFVLGIGGTITYPKNEILRDVVRIVGLEHIILETDSPFLPPQIIRGKQNQPRYIRTIAHYIGELLNLPYETVAATTTHNAERIFGI